MPSCDGGGSFFNLSRIRTFSGLSKAERVKSPEESATGSRKLRSSNRRSGRYFPYRQICNLPEYQKTTGLQIRLYYKDSVVR